MKNVYRIGCVFGLAFLFGVAVANAQVGGTDAGAQTGGAAPGAPAGGAGTGTSSGGNALSDLADQDAESGASTKAVAKPAPPASRNASFSRVTTTRKFVVPAPSQAARSGGTSTGAAAATRGSALHPSNPPGSKTGATAAKKSEIPDSSTWREAPAEQRPTRPPATAVRSVTHNYFPTMRGGQHVNRNTARVAHGGRTLMPGQAGVGMSARSPGTVRGGVPGRITPAQSSARPR
jgi:hypothetical protein